MKGVIFMRITKGNTSINIPNWLIVIGLLVVDNATCNICKVKSLNKEKES